MTAKLHINEEVIHETTKCSHDFACLKNEDHPCRVKEVEFCINKKIHFIDCKDWNCKYRMSYGNSSVCDCPVRKEIYSVYGK